MSETKNRKIKLLRYGELVARKARGEASSEELMEMERILRELNLSAEQIIKEIEQVVEKNY